MAQKKFVSIRVESAIYDEIAEISRVTLIPMSRLLGVCVPMLRERYKCEK